MNASISARLIDNLSSLKAREVNRNLCHIYLHLTPHTSSRPSLSPVTPLPLELSSSRKRPQRSTILTSPTRTIPMITAKTTQATVTSIQPVRRHAIAAITRWRGVGGTVRGAGAGAGRAVAVVAAEGAEAAVVVAAEAGCADLRC